MKHITIIDIANELGISKSTVSRALAGKEDIKEETKKMVLEAAQRMKYKPNFNAINLVAKRTKTIGVIVPEFVTPFFPTIITGIQDVLDKEGFRVLITQSNEDCLNEKKNINLMEDYMVEGIIMSLCRINKNAEEYNRLLNDGIPIVFFNRTSPNVKTSRVIIDDYNMSFFLVEHLIRAGKRRIAHLSGPNDLCSTIDRKKGYMDALKKFKIPYDSSLIIESGIDIPDGERAIKELINQEIEFDAIFGFNDPVAIGAMKFLKKQNLRIPEDVAVAGFSGTTTSTLLDPPLTSVEQPLYEMGKIAAELMIEKIKNPSAPDRTIILNAQLRIMESTIKKDNFFSSSSPSLSCP
ncbi:MAG: LacI family transcriptional regulator [Tannerella sp.]|jgi:DNA-binding LacI/PurR family transcriptional regulator|nr:LacI family transcriptional regulator [Tannerella sp.]